MNGWFESSPETERMLSEERLILACTELVHEAMDDAGVETKQQLAELLGVSKNEVGQRLSGRRNLTVKTLAGMLHVLGKEAEISLRPLGSGIEPAKFFELQQPLAAAHRSPYRSAWLTGGGSVDESVCAG